MDHYLVRIINDIFQICHGYRNHRFRSGYDYGFSRDIQYILKNTDLNAYLLLKIYLTEESEEYIRNDLKCELIRELARVDNLSSHDIRLLVIESCITSRSYTIRDSAILAISDMSDIRSLPVLEKAYQMETFVDLKKDISQAIKELEDIKRDLNTPISNI